MTFPDRRRLPLEFDALRLARDLRTAESDGWIAHFVQDNYEGEWSVIPLRAKAGATHPIMMIYSDPFCREFVDRPLLDSCPYFKEVLASFACPVQAARLMRLGSGSTILEHRDFDLDVEQGAARIHIPIVTSPEVVFLLNGVAVEMQAGSCWYLRLSDPHAVENRGKEARVHLVVDMTANAWLENLIADPSLQEA